jgi:hypothetical protein
MIKTTVNFLQERYDVVVSASQMSGINYKDIIRFCLLRFIADFEKGAFKDHALLYQKDAKKWKKVHFKMSSKEYDIYFDCKKVIRWSFSLIVAVAIDAYLESVINGNQEVSYHPDTYVKLYALIENCPIYLFSWKKNEKQDKIWKILRE